MHGMTRRWVLAGSIAAVTLAGAGSATAQVRGTIFGPGSRSYPIAVAPLKPLAGGTAARDAARTFAEVLERDMVIAGLFKVLDKSTFIEKAETSGHTEDSIDFGSWSVLGALALVKGACSVEGDRVTIEVRLFDVMQRRLLVGRRYGGSRSDVRRIANRFADEILTVFTGERGPFDSRLAFVSTRGGRFKEIYVMSPDGGDVRQVTRGRTIHVSPAWTDAAQGLLFTGYRRGNPDLFRLDLRSGRETMVSNRRGLNLGGQVSPDGSRIAVAIEDEGNVEIAVLSADGQLLRRVTSHWGIDVSPTWSPDGRRLAFCSNRSGGPQIYIVNADGGEPRRITHSGNYNTSPAWSPKGDRIAYVNRGGGEFNVFTVTPEGTDPRQLTRGSGNNEDPSWSPDGRYLVFSSSRTGSKKLFATDESGATQVQLTDGGGDDSSPAWSGWLD